MTSPPEGKNSSDNWLSLAIPGLLALYVLLTSTIDLIPSMDGYDAKRLIQISLLTTSLLLAALANQSLKHSIAYLINRIPSGMKWLLLVAFALGITSAFRHPEWAYSLADVGLLGLTIIMVFLVAACRMTAGKSFDRLVFLIISAAAALIVLQESIGLLAHMASGVEYSRDTMLINFAHPRFFNQIQSWLIPALACGFLIFTKSKRFSGFLIVLIALQWLVLFVSGGRGSLLGITTALLALSLLTLPKPDRWIRWQWLALLAGLLIFAGMVTSQQGPASDPAEDLLIEKSVGHYTSGHSSGRFFIWTLAYKLANQNPVFGIGPARLSCETGLSWGAHPHSFPVQLMVEWGWPAAVCIALVAFWLAWILLKQLLLTRHGQSYQDQLLRVLSFAVLAVAIHSLFSGVLVMPASQVGASLVCGWLLGVAAGQETNTEVVKRTFLLTWVCVLTVALGLATFTFVETDRNMNTVSTYSTPGTGHNPRFWQNHRICEN